MVLEIKLQAGRVGFPDLFRWCDLTPVLKTGEFEWDLCRWWCQKREPVGVVYAKMLGSKARVFSWRFLPAVGGEWWVEPKIRGICLKFKDWKLKRLGKDTSETWKMKMTFIKKDTVLKSPKWRDGFFPPPKNRKTRTQKEMKHLNQPWIFRGYA